MTSLLSRPLVGFVVGVGVAIAMSAVAQDSATPRSSGVVLQSGTGSSGQAVVDTSGQLSTSPAAPANFFMQYTLPNATCTKILTPPKNKAVVVTDISVDAYQVTNPGIGTDISFYSDKSCVVLVNDLNPPTVGNFSVSFGPGLVTTTLYAEAASNLSAEVYVHGYVVSDKAAPSVVISATSFGRASRNHQH